MENQGNGSARRALVVVLAVVAGLALASRETSAACSGEVTKNLRFEIQSQKFPPVCKWSAAVTVDGCTVTKTTFKGAGQKPATGTMTVGRSGSYPKDIPNTSAVGTNGDWKWSRQSLNCNTPLGCGTGTYYIHIVREPGRNCGYYGVQTVTVQKS